MSIHYAFEELDRKFPDDSLAFARIGEALIREERTAEAIRMLTSGTSRYPRYITGLLVLARAYKAADRTAEAKSELEKVKDTLQQQRDELRVQVHLAKLEAKSEWDQAEQKFHALEGKLQNVSTEVSEASKDVLASARLLTEEIQHAYERIRRHL